MLPQTNCRIWVIDDDIAILEAIEAVLTEEKYTVCIINDPIGIEKHIATEELPQLIFLDVLMSGVDGRDVATILKKNKKTKHIPIVMLSANMKIEEITKEVNADGYLWKPFDINELIRITKKFTS